MVQRIVLLLVLFPLYSYSQNDVMKNDWPNLKKYAAENTTITPTSGSVVLWVIL